MNGKAGLYIHIPFALQNVLTVIFIPLNMMKMPRRNTLSAFALSLKNTGARHLIQSISAGAHPVCSIQN